jgi:predicted acyltransferase (DUF342 family)
MRALFTRILALVLALLAPLAGAATYTLPGTLPPGCSGSGPSYSCSSLTLGYNDVIVVNSPKPATLTINGNFSTDNAQINQAGSASDLTLVVNGTLVLGYQARIKANITATSVNDNGGGGVVITGNLAANGGNISLAYQTSVSGNVSTSGSGTITTGQNGSIGGNVTGGSGSISISEAGTVSGNVTGTGNITVVQSATVSGNLSAGSGAVSIGYQAKVNGNLDTTGTIQLAQGSRIGGNVTGGSGNVTVGYAATVIGTLTTSSGTIDIAQNAVTSACVKSTGSATITLGYQSNVNSVCCGTSCSNSCVVNNSTYAMPPLCAGSTVLVADYRMDETSWNGTAGEVKDASSNAYHARSATASTGVPVAITVSGSPAYGTTSNGSCGYGLFNRASPSPGATHALVQLPSGFPAMSSSFTVMAWIRSTSPTQSGQRIIANDDNQDGWALSLGDAGSASVRLFSRNLSASGSVTTGGSNGSGATNANCSSGTFCLDSAPIIAANTWYYVAATVDTAAKQVQTFIYNTSGSLLASASSAFSGNWVAGSGATAIGGETASSGEGQSSNFHFYGNIDELQVYTGVLGSSAISAQLSRSRSCPVPAIASFAISGTGGASTCTPQTLTLTARDASGNTLTNYTGTVNLSTSTGRGDWSAGSSPSPSGSLSTGSANSGLATYTFSTGDAGIVKLRLAHSLAQNVTVTVVDAGLASTASTSAAITYRDNAFVWAEDLSNRIAGTNVVVAGRAHDLRVSLIKRDPSTGSCGTATDFAGTRSLKLWRTDSGGTWTAPSAVVGSTTTSVPAARPASNNLSLTFTAGVATFNLATTDIGKYTLNLDDDSGTYAANTINGTLGDLTVRPYAVVVSGINRSGTANPAGRLATDTVFATAGGNFSATVAAYRWASGSDANNDGVPDSSASLATTTAGGLAPSFNSAVTLSPLSGSQTPAGGVLGRLANATITGFSGGTVTVSNLQYDEVGSFQLNNTGVVAAFLGTPGLSLNALTFSSSGAQNTRVGRFIPAGFAVSNTSVVHRVDLSCSTASTFTYLDENFRLRFTLTAQNAAGATTLNYIDDPSSTNYQGNFARLDLATPASLSLAGISGSTLFKTGVGGRLSVDSSSGSWASGVASNVTIKAKATRTLTPDGPFTAAFGVAPTDSDGVTLSTPDLDTDSPANGNDRARVGTIPLHWGRLRLQNGMAAANRPVYLPLAAQSWNGSAFTTNTLDSCTRIASTNLSFGNLRKSLVASDAVMSNSPVTVNAGVGSITLQAPGSSRVGTLDVAISLDTAADSSCLGWTPTKAATAGAGLLALRGLWCGSSATKDPSARATWGLYRGDNGVIYQKENY